MDVLKKWWHHSVFSFQTRVLKMLRSCSVPGLSRPLVEKEKRLEQNSRAVEPRRRCASESSISSCNSLLGRWCVQPTPSAPQEGSRCSDLFIPFLASSTLPSLPKCGKGKPALVRRHTVDDKSELIACIETGNFAKAARIAAGNISSVKKQNKRDVWGS